MARAGSPCHLPAGPVCASWPLAPLDPSEGRGSRCSVGGTSLALFHRHPSIPGGGLEGALCPWSCDSSSSALALRAQPLPGPSFPAARQRVWARPPWGGGLIGLGPRLCGAVWLSSAQGAPQPCPPLAPGCQSPGRPTAPRCTVTSCGSSQATTATPGRRRPGNTPGLRAALLPRGGGVSWGFLRRVGVWVGLGEGP